MLKKSQINKCSDEMSFRLTLMEPWTNGIELNEAQNVCLVGVMKIYMKKIEW